MEAFNVEQFTKRYFEVNDCTVKQTGNGLLEVNLTEEMDKKIMNRPFYWHYVKATHAKGIPKTVLLGPLETYENKEIEPIYFGSTRFQQILKELVKETSFIQSFESVQTTDNKAMYPWLLVNIKVSYESMQIKDEIFSLGLNLITGMITVNMMEHLQAVQMHATISPHCYVLSPIITYDSGFKRLQHILDVYIEEQSHEWALLSMQAMEDELHLLHLFYEDETEDKINEMHAIQKRYEPRITFNVLSGGVVYLTESFQSKKEK